MTANKISGIYVKVERQSNDFMKQIDELEEIELKNSKLLLF
jgi:hypothetical protein